MIKVSHGINKGKRGLAFRSAPLRPIERPKLGTPPGPPLSPFLPIAHPNPTAAAARGDFHAQPFGDGAFDFEFSNVFDNALYPDRFAAEIERTLRLGGVAVLHVAVHRRGDKYSANDLLDVEGLVGLFRRCDVVRVSKVDAFGLDTEVILRKKRSAA